MSIIVRNTKNDDAPPLRAAVYGDPGAGKAQPFDALVMTPDGAKEIGFINVGDAVLGLDGKPTEVLGVFPQGHKHVYEIVFDDGAVTRCSDDHLWTIYNHNAWTRQHPPITAPLSSFMDNLFAIDGMGHNYRLPIRMPAEFTEAAVPLHPYAMGLLLGDGGFRSGILFHNDEEDLVARLRELIAPLGLVLGGAPMRWTLSTGRRGGNITNPLREIMRDFELMGCLSLDKFVPDVYKRLNVDGRLDVLRGLIDTDGDIGINGTVTANTSSLRLANDIVWLVESLGGSARLHSRIPTYIYEGEKKAGHRAYRITIRLPNGMRPVASEKHLQRWKENTPNRQPSRFFDSVNYVGDAECVCIKVAATDGIYLTDHFIATHNTTFACTFPRPFVFAMGSESGISSINQLNASVDYALINTTEDMLEALMLFKSEYKQREWRTAVVDTATVYGRYCTMQESRYGTATVEFTQWMKILGHFLNMRDVLHQCNVHVVWVFHADDFKSGDVVIRRGPKLVGQARAEILQTCGLLCYLDKVERAEARNEKGEITTPAQTIRRLWVRCPEGSFPAFETKSWYEQVLTAPCYVPTFERLAKELCPAEGRKHITI